MSKLRVLVDEEEVLNHDIVHEPAADAPAPLVIYDGSTELHSVAFRVDPTAPHAGTLRATGLQPGYSALAYAGPEAMPDAPVVAEVTAAAPETHFVVAERHFHFKARDPQGAIRGLPALGENGPGAEVTFTLTD